MKMLYFLAKFGFIMLGSAFSASFIPPEFSVILGIAFFLGFFGLVLFGKKFREISVLFLAAAIGFSLVAIKLYTEYYPASALDGMKAKITGTVTEISSGGGNPVYTVKTDSIGISGAPRKLTVLLSGWDENSANSFDKISCEVTFRVFGEQNAEDFFSDRSKGIFICAYTNSPIEITGKDDSSFGFFVHIMREKISSVIYRYYIDWHAPFMEKLLVGSGEGPGPSVTNAFRRSGMSHILAISGMHMVVITGLFEKLFLYRKTEGKIRKIETVVLIFITVLYMFIGGLGMSVLRSGFMLIAHYISRLAFSGSKSLDNLGIAIAAVLIIDPLASCDVGFLMSVISCCAISVFVPPLKKKVSEIIHFRRKSFFDFITESFCVSFVAFLAVLPVSAVVFGEISLVSPFSNLFAGFFAQYSIIFGILTVIFGLVPFLGFFAGGTAFISMLCGGILYKIAEFFSGFSFAYVEANDLWFYIWLFGSAVLIIFPALYSNSFSYIKHSAVMSVFVLLCGIIIDFIAFSGVSEIKISALEHGTAISCSKDGRSVLIVHDLDSSDRFDIGPGFDTFISLDAKSSSSEQAVISFSNPENAFISSEELFDRYENVSPVSSGIFSFSENGSVEIISESAVCIETNGITLLYIFEECDIMDISPKFRKADIAVLDGVSPEDFPILRCERLILRKFGGYYSGTSEITVLKEGEISFFAYNGNIKEGGFSG